MENIATTTNQIVTLLTSTSSQVSALPSVFPFLQSMPFYSMAILIIIFSLLVVAIKGYSLWYAARRDEKWWFVALLLLNTMGILELVYLIFFVKRWPKIYGGRKGVSSEIK